MKTAHFCIVETLVLESIYRRPNIDQIQLLQFYLTALIGVIWTTLCYMTHIPIFQRRTHSMNVKALFWNTQKSPNHHWPNRIKMVELILTFLYIQKNLFQNPFLYENKGLFSRFVNVPWDLFNMFFFFFKFPVVVRYILICICIPFYKLQFVRLIIYYFVIWSSWKGITQIKWSERTSQTQGRKKILNYLLWHYSMYTYWENIQK